MFGFAIFLGINIVKIGAKKFNNVLIEIAEKYQHSYIPPLMDSSDYKTRFKYLFKRSKSKSNFYHGYLEGVIDSNTFTLKAEFVGDGSGGNYVSCLEVFMNDIPKDLEIYIPNFLSKFSKLWGSKSQKIGSREFQKHFKLKTNDIESAEGYLSPQREHAFIKLKHDLQQFKRTKFLFQLNDCGFFILFANLFRKDQDLETLLDILKSFLNNYHLS